MEPKTDAAPRGHAGDPSPALEHVFTRIQRERMRDVPILNPALRVEAVGFQPWQGHWIGVLVTPWFMNAMVLPGPGAEWPARNCGDIHTWPLPIGPYDFMVAYHEEIGEYHLCSLMSPVLRIEDQDAARITAQSALVTLLTTPAPKEEPSGPLATIAEHADKPMSKREFLSGRMFRR